MKMPKLLDYVKEEGLTHEEVIELIKNRNLKPEEPEVKVEEPEVEVGEIDKPDEEIELVKDKVEEDSTETEQISTEEVEEEKPDISDKIKEEDIQLKIKRKTPSKGVIKQEPTIEYGITSHRGYEVKTIREK